ncbi:NAD(P)H-dependent oxidoreductase [Bacillus sp. 1NLA3E]|uniref:NAD(P)H-dependent oxidoreductase n=1 Tax=Bacillus sp. 1NLA3E TaxID=666686 RepID=UPI000247EDC6|nr:NAD(P)H-dependent oxidoreductase [Bacillus sp. 1NLA3E]AGK53720.1 putative NAD(P)H dehydrogenase (quinone) [Bacillus sp. 1NLA3E]
MKHLIVFSHPHAGSFNHAILETTVNALKSKGHQVTVRDLYEINFQPVLKAEDTAAMRDGQVPEDIKKEQEYIAEADVITFIYPIWWTGLPAIIKGYVDRVFSYGFAYASGEEGIIKLLKGKKGLIINTHGTPKEIYDQIGMTAGLKVTSDTGIFNFTGIEPVEHLLFGSVPYVDDAARKDMLKTVENTIHSHFA